MEEKPERREYFRVKDVLQVALKKLPPFSVLPTSRMVGYPLSVTSDFSVPSETVDPFIIRQFQAIHQKLDAILEYLCLEKLGFVEMEYKEVDFSAGGMRVATLDKFEEGDILEVKLVLPTAPPIYLICYGVVKRCTECDEKREVAVEFTNMSEDIRSIIVKYVLQRQRQDIRR
ncbi:MAG: PilZ domain-containing protein [Thermodesulforhabdaceae bacterium]|jgi:c-di-GMP-binding flagellar brake protein YcgR